MIILLVLGLIIRRCLKDSKEMCGKVEAIAIWVLLIGVFAVLWFTWEWR